ncbi:hypothetical protein VISI1226_09869 [Vibrio sinaloensis DSM 21326]|uniref:Aminoglycoside phosphotransferase domain-containing protein n=1 Tax=Vibrio sinaloensis DSM 21326 TaxID=945550 RepID=E8M9C2_PHOS4|nr:phosphotransferase [Vibrio sinaloensis]EGA69478.1 hypothetical protein VISI1226_09869 [Vibrio sinaloensis DSM 21326]
MAQQTHPSDDHIPGMPILFDSPQITGLFSEIFNISGVEPVQREYLRYKPNTSCLCLYQTKYAGQFHLFYAKAFSDPAKVSKAVEKMTTTSTLAQSHCKVDIENQVVLYRYPCDNRLSGLAALITPHERRSLLQRALFDNTQVLCSVTPLQYKPERRFVGRLNFPNGTQAVVKVYTQERYTAVAKSYLKRDTSPFATLRGKSDKHCLLIYDWIEGEHLKQEGQLTEQELEQYYQCGKALSALHNSHCSKKIKPISTDKFSRLLIKHVDDASHVLPENSAQVLWLGEQLVQRINALPTPSCFIHGDFYAEQVLITPEGAKLLDFDNICCWYSSFDIGNFLAHLDYKVAVELLDVEQLGKIEQSLLDGYKTLGDVNHQEVMLFRAIGLIQLIYHPLRFGMHDWRAASRKILCKCHQYLTSSVPQGEWLHLDPSMPQLTHLLNLKELNLALLDSPCDEIEHCVLTRFKVGKRAIIECWSKETSLIGKIRAKGFDNASWCTQNALYESGFSPKNDGSVQVPKPIVALPHLNIWFQEKVTGHPLFQPFCYGHNLALPRRLAFALYKLHNCVLETNKVHSIEDELSILEQNLQRIISKLPEHKTRVQRILSWSQVLVAQLPHQPSRPIHRDFYHDQILVSEQTIYLLDFDLFCHGSPFIDVGNFVAHIQEQCLREVGDPFFAQTALDEFVHRYALLSGLTDSASAINTFRLLSLARHIAISQRIPARREFTPQIIGLCEDEIRKAL